MIGKTIQTGKLSEVKHILWVRQENQGRMKSICGQITTEIPARFLPNKPAYCYIIR